MHVRWTLVDAAAPQPVTVDVAVSAPVGTRLGDVGQGLLAAVGRSDGPVFCGGAQLSHEALLGLGSLVEGAVLTVGRPGPTAPNAGLLQLRVTGGPDAGSIHFLGPGEVRIGRAPVAEIRIDDPDVSRLHAAIRVTSDGVTLHDLGSTNGTTLDGIPVHGDEVPLRPGEIVRVGDTSVALALPDDPPAAVQGNGQGRIAINRPPRIHPPAPVIEIMLPTAPRAREAPRFPLIAMLVPLVAGGILAAVLRQPALLALTLLSPAMVLGNVVSDRVSGRAQHRRAMAQHERDLAAARRRIDSALADEVALRRHDAPDPATVLSFAETPRSRLWERRRGDDDVLAIRLGTADLPSRLLVRAQAPADTVDPPRALGVPVTVSLRDVGVLGLAGPRERLDGLARAAIAHLAGLHSPHDVEIVVLADVEPRRWAWMRWLPHLRPRSGQDCTLLVGADAEQVAARLAELLALLDGRRAARGSQPRRPWAGPFIVVVLDGSQRLRSLPGVARLLAEGPAVGIVSLCLAEQPTQLPTECAATAVIVGEVATRLRIDVTGHGPVLDAVADLVGVAWAERFARALAPLQDATPEDDGAGLPITSRLLEVTALDPPTPDAIAARWSTGGRSALATIGVGVHGPLTIDLRRDGPHALIAGTTGAGKSELLQTLVASLALANRPGELTFLLVDYKGGSAFKDCARLPHTAGLVTDLDGHLTTRALMSLDAELKRRERMLRAAGAKDIEDFHAGTTGAAEATLPRLVIVIDEFAALVNDLPDFVRGVVDIAARGRSLGIHLVLATQRPGGVVSPDIRANTMLRIALRVSDASESIDIIDTKDAALIPKSAPGRAYLRSGAGPVVPFQSARVGGRPLSAGDVDVSVRRLPWQELGNPRPRRRATDDTTRPTDLARLVDAVLEATATLGIDPAPAPWLPPLPEVVTLDDLADAAPVAPHSPERLPIGVTDVPREQRRGCLTVDLARGGHLLVAGAPRSGRSTALRTLAGAVAARCGVRDVHLYGFDCGSGALLPAAQLPHCGALVSRDQTDRGARLLTRLLEETARRQELLGRSGFGSVAEQRAVAPPTERLPWILLMVDGWEGFAAAYEAVDHGRPVDSLHRLLREGPAVGLRAVITGDRSTLTGRLPSVMPERLLLRMADPLDFGLAGVHSRDVPGKLPTGRGLLPLADGTLEAQVALLSRDPAGPAQLAALSALARHAAVREAGVPRRYGPFRVEQLPVTAGAADVFAAARGGAIGPPLWTVFAVGGDELGPVGVDLAGDGPAFVVAGPARSGRSTTLLTMARWLTDSGADVVAVAPRRSPLRALQGRPGVRAVVGRNDAEALRAALAAAPGELVVLADDAEALLDTPVEEVLLGLLREAGNEAAGRPRALVVAGSCDELAGTYRGITVEARKSRCGLLLAPTGPLAGDLLGAYVPRATEPQPGRGVLVVHGQTMPVQVARP